MALFNRISKKKQKKVINRAGGEAYAQSPEMKLASILLTSFAQDQYYRSAQQTLDELTELLPKVRPEFAAKAAVYARREFGMRSITHVLAAELATHLSGKDWAKKFYESIVKRPDDMLEIIAYFKAQGTNSLPNAMKKGFAKAFDRFDSYQLAKYRGEGRSVKLVDIVNLVHPVPTERNEAALKALIAGELRNTQTWEAKLTQAGQSAETEEQKAKKKKEAWAELLKSNKLGYMALIRNLRNIMEHAPDMIPLACDQVKDAQRIKKSMMLPFRLITAYMQFCNLGGNSRLITSALEQAIEIACDNVPYLENTLVVIDNSGSMGSPVSNSEHIKCNQMGAAFGMLLAKRCNADIIEFGTTARYIPYSLRTSVMNFATKFAENNKVGHGTNFHSIFEAANQTYDRIVIFSDMQGWVGHYAPTKTFEQYKLNYNADPYIYSFDLRGYGSMQFSGNKVFQLAGFSEKIFDLMEAVEQNPRELLSKIEAVEW